MLKLGPKSFLLNTKNLLPICLSKSYALLSHAHWDHLRYCKEKVAFCTYETSQLIKHIFKNKVNPWPYKHELKIEELSIRLFPSGHILGSAQFFIQTQKTTFAITNDFKLEDSLLLKGAEILEAENLIIETTFAKPGFKFPKREILYNEITAWIKKQLDAKRKVLLFAYPLGKSQELIAILNEYLSISPAVSWEIYYFSNVYKRFGHNLNYVPLRDIKEEDVILLPKAYATFDLLNALAFQGIKFSTAYFSGWALKNNFKLFDKTFPLSDHADFDQLMQYVEKSNAKRIYTFHGYAKEFANYLCKKGYNASTLSQKTILNYF